METLISIGWELIHLRNLFIEPGTGPEVRVMHPGSSGDRAVVRVVFDKEVLFEAYIPIGPSIDILSEAVELVRQRVRSMSEAPGILTRDVMGS